ncbi:hypothetical protein HGRIS_012606 [Hohenbuehelia grisea]|uniref:HSF-type DNA-binding domain-containing protein n=1 Tax=Hohenbuehelia grisea TaxID=104357 RepID=A0ABR3IT27_9AGAR
MTARSTAMDDALKELGLAELDMNVPFMSPMATDSQVALTRARRGSTHLSKATRQVVPAFLQKLYEMVNDPSNADLIRWSEAGDSFFVLDHERFAREVLGRWFKHQNFSSFVRQLNMYGFHKIPHLQAGVLKSDAETEFWNFEHPHFHRGQPDLLCLIQRKKQAAQGDDVTAAANADVRDAAHPVAGSITGTNLSAGQVLDIHSIVQGISAIKRHQQTISAELIELRKSNQMLWQDALAARARHQKHQDTINRILKFLAGVFGHSGSPVHKEDGVDGSPRAVFPRNSQRLMIEEAPQKEAKGFVRVEEVRDAESPELGPKRGISPVVQYPTVETPKSLASPLFSPSGPPSPSISEATSYSLSAPFLTPGEVTLPPAFIDPPVSKTQPPATAAQSTPTPPAQPQPVAAMPSSPLTSLTTTSGSSTDQDIMMQQFQQMLQSPAQFQRLLSALSSTAIPDSLQTSSDAPSQQLAQYPGAFDFSRASLDHYTPQGLLAAPPAPVPTPPSEGLIPFDPPLAENAQHLDHTWKATQDIDRDVNALHSSISSLINTFGLDPSLIDSPSIENTSPAISAAPTPAPMPPPTSASASTSATASSSTIPMSSIPPPPGLDAMDTSVPAFDLDAFLTEYGNNQSEDYGDLASTAFLDEVPSPSDGTASPAVTMLHDFQESPKARGRKRKSDVTELEDGFLPASVSALPVPPPSKTKRKR